MKESVGTSDDEDEDNDLVGPPVPPGFDPSSVVPGPSSGAVLRHQVAGESDSDEEQVEGGEESEVCSIVYGDGGGRGGVLGMWCTLVMMK